VNIALSVDALAPSLTGIGRYTWELVQGLQQHADITKLGFYRHGRAISDPTRYLRDSGDVLRYWPGQRWLQQRAYNKLIAGSFCHGTNYFLPKEAQQGVITVHDLSVFKYPQTHPAARIQEFEKLLPDSIARSSHIITDSETVRQEVIDYFQVKPNQISAVYLGVDQRFKPAACDMALPLLTRLGLQKGHYTLCVSTLEPRKQLKNLVEAYRLLPLATRQAYPLVLAGTNGWLNADLMHDIDRAVQQGWLFKVGFVAELDLVQLYQGASLFVYPSLYEGFGLPVLEAMASGVPVLITANACLMEVAGGAARIAEHAEPEHLTVLIAELLEDVKQRQTWSAAGLRRSAEFSWAKCLNNTVDIYKRAGAIG
jgi:alpha-1,3-rhamnosyl/mannosyltransferase